MMLKVGQVVLFQLVHRPSLHRAPRLLTLRGTIDAIVPNTGLVHVRSRSGAVYVLPAEALAVRGGSNV